MNLEDLARADQGEVTELVRARLGVQAPHADALELLAIEGTSTAAVRESLRRAVVDLLRRFANSAIDLDDDEAADLLTLTSFLLGPGAVFSPEDRAIAVRSLCSLAYSEYEEVARKARSALLDLRAPGTVEFWQQLAESTTHPPNPSTVFLGLADASLDAAFSFIGRLLEAGTSVDDVRVVLLEALPELQDESSHVRAALARFLADHVPPDDRPTLADAGLSVGIGLNAPGPAAGEAFLDLVAKWQELVASDAPYMEPDRLDALLVQICDHATIAFLELDQSQRLLAADVLTANITNPRVAQLAVTTLLTVHEDQALAERIIRHIPGVTMELADWYLSVAELVTDGDRRARVVAALYDILPPGEDKSFLRLITVSAGWRAAEVYDNEGIDTTLRLALESERTSNFKTYEDDFKTLLSDPEFLSNEDPW